jgi:RNA polymerase I-specific transcription initiation factor RRN11
MIPHSDSDRNHKFLFSLPGLENADSARKEMIRRIYDACIYSMLLGDIRIARKAFGLLLRCKEFKWKDFWSLAVYMLNPHDPDRDNTFVLSQVDQLRSLMVQDRARVSHSTSAYAWTQRISQGVELLNELLQVLVQNGRCTEALDEIELSVIMFLMVTHRFAYYFPRYLPLFPYQDNPVLHTYTGLIRLYMSQEPDSRRGNESPDGLLEGAKASLNRVIEIDSENRTARFFLDLVQIAETLQTQGHRLISHSQIALIHSDGTTDPDPDLSKDEASEFTQDNYMIGNAPKRTKRGEHVIMQAAMRRYELATPPSPTSERNDD